MHRHPARILWTGPVVLALLLGMLAIGPGSGLPRAHPTALHTPVSERSEEPDHSSARALHAAPSFASADTASSHD
jgi:hypothetical protein